MAKHPTPAVEASAPLTGTFYDQPVTAEPYFTADNVIEAVNLDWINRAWMTNRGNAFGNAIRGAKTAHLRATSGDDNLKPTTAELATVSFAQALHVAEYHDAQAWFNAICASFDPTATRGQAEARDPVEAEAMDIAGKEFDAFVSARGIKPGALKTTKLADGTTKYKALFAQWLSKRDMDAFRDRAREAIAARTEAVSTEDFDLDAALEALPTEQAEAA